MSVDALTAFLGWCTVINFGLLIFSGLAVMLGGRQVAAWHARLFALEPTQLPGLYFQYLAHFKIGFLLLNLVPYLALKAM